MKHLKFLPLSTNPIFEVHDALTSAEFNFWGLTKEPDDFMFKGVWRSAASTILHTARTVYKHLRP